MIASTATGNWSAPTTWSPSQVPTQCNPVNVVTATTVTLDTSAMASTTTIIGQLSFSRTASGTFTIVGGSVSVNTGGTLDMGTAGSPINASSATLILAYGSSAGHYGLVVNNGGNFLVYGSTRTPWALGTGTASGTNVPVVTTGLNWNAGDTVTVDTEVVTIQSLTGSALTVSPALTLTHSTPTVVADLSRNVVVRSSGTNTSANTAWIESLASNTTSFNVNYGEFDYIGANGYSGAYQGSLSFTQGGGLQPTGSISSSTVRGGYIGISILGGGSTNVTLTSNLVFNNDNIGIYSYNGQNNTLISNLVYASGVDGIDLLNSSHNNQVLSNLIFNNGQNGISLYTGSNNSNTLEQNNIYKNFDTGIDIQNGSNNLIVSNIIDNNSPAAGQYGMALLTTTNNLMMANVLYSNGAGGGGGIYSSLGSGDVCVGCLIGYSSPGVAAHDGNGSGTEILFDNTNTENLTLKAAN